MSLARSLASTPILALVLLLSGNASATEVRMQTAASRDVATVDAQLEGLLAAGHLRRESVEVDETVAGRRHERLTQYYRGVPVWRSGITRQRSASGTVSIFGLVFDDIGDLDMTPDVSAEAARVVAVGAFPGGTVPERMPPQLYVFPLREGGFVLAWRVYVLAPKSFSVCFVDAKNGRIVHTYNDLKTDAAVGLGTGVLGDRKKVSASGEPGAFVSVDELRPASIRTFDLRASLNRFIAVVYFGAPLLPNDYGRDDDNDWTDGQIVDAHTYAGWTYDYYFKRHGRNGLNNGNSPLEVVVNGASPSSYFSLGGDFPELFTNAFWHGFGFAFFGAGAPVPVGGQMWKPLAGSLDVVAHELTHGVTQYTSDLIYEDEPGALNEAFSDIMGVSVEFFHRPNTNYLIGDDVITPGGLRSMNAPSMFGDPDHYSIRFTGTFDSGGVHINSSIVNHAFYLAVEGGTNRVSGLQVKGVGAANRDQLEKVFYRGFTLLLGPSANFSQARAATLQAARDLYGEGSAAFTATVQAWNAVGVN